MRRTGSRVLFLAVFRLFVGLVAKGHQLPPTVGEVKEYCEWESFNATCRPEEVIVIGSARYGRMRLGRCVMKNYGHIGCGSDVTSYFDKMCSGRHSCVIVVIKLHDKISCPTDFKSYLEASYECVRVITNPEGTCANTSRSIIRAPSGLLASVVAMETGFGTADCPWIINVEGHQRINITLFDFSSTSSEESDAHEIARSPPSECNEYAVVTEGVGELQLNSSICGGRGRQGIAFVSSSNSMEIRIIVSSRIPHFLLKYEAFGCSPLVAPSGAWLLNNGHQAVVKCNETEETWRLICRGRRWDGYLGNCSTPIASAPKLDEDWMIDSSFPYGILLVIALGVLIGVAAGVLMLLAVLAYMRRRRIRKIRSRSNYVIDDTVTGSHSFDGKLIVTPGSTDRRTPIFKASSSSGLSDPFLSRQGTWQRTRPLPVPSIDGQTSDHRSNDGMVLMPVTTSELPLLSPYSLEEPLMPSSGIFGTFGPGYHEQCINLLRRSSSNRATGGAAAGATGCSGISAGREQGPYYFKLDLSGVRNIDHLDPNPSQCVMCQAGSIPVGVRDHQAGAATPGTTSGQAFQRQLDECYQ